MDNGIDGKSAGGCVAAVSLMSSTSMIYVDDGVNNKSGGGRDAALLLILLMWCNNDCEIGYCTDAAGICIWRQLKELLEHMLRLLLYDSDYGKTGV